MEERLLTAREAANLLGVYFRTLRRWAREGRVASVRLSENQVRFRPSDLAALIEVRKRPTRAIGRSETAVLETLTTIEARLAGAGESNVTHEPGSKPRRPKRKRS